MEVAHFVHGRKPSRRAILPHWNAAPDGVRHRAGVGELPGGGRWPAPAGHDPEAGVGWSHNRRRHGVAGSVGRPGGPALPAEAGIM